MNFFQTGMGKMFYEGTVPRLVRAVERIADLLEKAEKQARATDDKLDKRVFHCETPHAVAELCDYCANHALIPGAVFPVEVKSGTEHAFVQRCDECSIFIDDVAAAVCVAAHLRKIVGFDGGNKRPFVAGFTFEEAEEFRAGRLD